MDKSGRMGLSVAIEHPFPHLKLRHEPFPRLLATRRLVDDGSEYFGAFLGRTAVRILIDFVNRTFRLRSCDIEIDGDFPYPCTQYYSRRCIAPCVDSLCSETEYQQTVELVRLFLLNDREALRSALRHRIDGAAKDLAFETAAKLRDMLTKVEEYWKRGRWQVWLNDSVDTYDVEHSGSETFVYLLSQRRRNTLGRHVFKFTDSVDPSTDVRGVISMIYQFHLPREIRVTAEFSGRRQLEQTLSQKFARPIKIKITPIDNGTLTAERGFAAVRREQELRAISIPEPVEATAARIMIDFGLDTVPRLIEAYDVAHISATLFVSAGIAWAVGGRTAESFDYEQSVETSETAALREFIRRRTLEGRTRADLVLIDGGRHQLVAAISGSPERRNRHFRIVAAVKPPGKHLQISHFLTEDGDRIEFQRGNSGHTLLLAMRDEAHELANSVHRLSRDMAPFYELAGILPSVDESCRQKLLRSFGSIKRIVAADSGTFYEQFDSSTAGVIISDLEAYHAGPQISVKPLIVPLRLDEQGGQAEDLRPILTTEPEM